MAVRIRMKKMGRAHRPYYRIVAMDKRSPRDGRVIEELGTYDPMCPETDARVSLKSERIEYWIGVGAQPSDKVGVLIKKYGTDGTHLDAQKEAVERLGKRKDYTPAPEPVKPAKKKKEEEPKAEAQPTEETGPAADAAPEKEAAADAAPAEEAPAAEKAKAE
jgi:small subunit ribosomal protein S16